jgi:hypothetical protein
MTTIKQINQSNEVHQEMTSIGNKRHYHSYKNYLQIQKLKESIQSIGSYKKYKVEI